MATQIIRPDSDVQLNGWTDDGGGTTNIFQAIDEVAASETDFIHSGNNPALDISEFSLENPTTIDVKDSDGHTINYRYAKSAAGGRTIELQVRLLDGVLEIASWTHSNISDTWTEANQTLDSTQTSAITDWDDLRLEFQGDTSGSGAGRRAQVSWAEMGVNGTVAATQTLDMWDQPTHHTVPDVEPYTVYSAEEKPVQEPELVTLDKWFYPNGQPVEDVEPVLHSGLTEPMIDVVPTPREGIITGGSMYFWDDEVVGT